jgi:hypothetical protein
METTSKTPDVLVGPIEEIKALDRLIKERKTGWAVEIAIQRMKRLVQFIEDY